MSPMLDFHMPPSPALSHMDSNLSHYSPTQSPRPHTLPRSHLRVPPFNDNSSHSPSPRAAVDPRDPFNFASLVHSRFNPLRYCNASIVARFARVSSRLQMVECYSIMALNKKLASKRRNTPVLTGRQVRYCAEWVANLLLCVWFGARDVLHF